MTTFNEMNLSPSLMRAIQELGYETPSPIQAAALPILLGQPTDFLGLAATGTGKTAAFSLPLIERLDTKIKGVQALILCPTRELALQVSGQINLMGKFTGVKALPVYGGSSYSEQIQGLKRGDSIVVGTPGRVIDHIERGTLSLSKVHTLILDEADEMISMGFKDELDKILSQLPPHGANTWLFSATLSPEVRRVAERFLKNPQKIQINRTEVLSDTVEQFYYVTREQNKPDIICKLIDGAEDFYGIIFCQTKALVSDLSQYLAERGYKVDSLHGDKDQNSRERTMNAFRDHKVNVLICTDVASRGLDVKDITHVINYSIPRELESYVHRIGRTARIGKAGLAFSLVSPAQRGMIERVERVTKSKMKEGRLPTRRELGAKKVSQLLETFQTQKFHTRAIEVLDEAWKETLKDMTADEIVGRFLCLNFPDVFTDKELAKPEFEQHREQSSSRRDYSSRGGGGGGGGGARRERNRGGSGGGSSGNYPRRSRTTEGPANGSGGARSGTFKAKRY